MPENMGRTAISNDVFVSDFQKGYGQFRQKTLFFSGWQLKNINKNIPLLR